MDPSALIDQLTPERRLALAYAPRSSRQAFLALFALDARLGGVVRAAREPMLAQLRLAWWREQLEKPHDRRASGEPLIAALAGWGDAATGLVALVDGWELLLGDAPIPAQQFEAFFDARGRACAALAEMLGANAREAHRAGRNWAIADLAGRLTHPDERRDVQSAAGQADWSKPRFDRSMRPLLVLHAMAAQSKGQGIGSTGFTTLLMAIRLGMLGI